MTGTEFWKRPTEEPADRQECCIIGNGSMIIRGIIYFSELKAWVDVLATPESGASYGAGAVWGWCPVEQIPDVPDDYEPRSQTATKDPNEQHR